MVKTAQSTLSPAAKIARKLLAHVSLSDPPIPVWELVQERADLCEDSLPLEIDALAIMSGGKRPRVFLEQSRPPTRKRFTLGHELGHIVIPWHHGTLICNVGDRLFGIDDSVRVIETEANIFSSEVLLPRGWLSSQICTEIRDYPDLILSVASTAQVSPAAAIFALHPYCLSPAIFFILGPERVEYCYKTTTWAGPPIGPWVPNPIAELHAYGAEIFRTSYYGGREIIVATKQVPNVGSAPALDSKDLIKRLVQEHFPLEKQAWALQSINGTVGSANTKATNKDPQEIYTVLFQRFQAKREEYQEILGDARFSEFLRAKAHEIAARSS